MRPRQLGEEQLQHPRRSSGANICSSTKLWAFLENIAADNFCFLFDIRDHPGPFQQLFQSILHASSSRNCRPFVKRKQSSVLLRLQVVGPLCIQQKVSIEMTKSFELQD